MNTNTRAGVIRGGLWKGPAFVTALILLVPLLRNLFVYGWDWDLRGFLVVGGVGSLLFGTCLTYQMVTKKLATPTYMTAVGVALVSAFLLVWGNFVQAADDVNRDAIMYLCVPLVAIIGAGIARFRPDGMARAFFITALAQALVLTIALIVRNPQLTPWTPAVLRGFGTNALLVLLFAGSALLFRKAGRGNSEPATV
jgi:hypothetical protein